jgi:16S rRNA processing protein RimM
VSTYADTDDLFHGFRLWLRSGHGVAQPIEIDRVYSQKNTLVMKIRGVDDIGQAEKLAGQQICIRKNDLEPAADDEYYWHELIGLAVIDEAGISLGTLTSIIPTGANDVYVVTAGDNEMLLPATVEVVREVDLEKSVMVVRLPEVF